MENNSFVITPDTRLHALLSNYPALEDKLISMSPAYAKLKNPVLRRTIGKVATLRQVAEIGKIPLGEFINTLRKETGENREYLEDDTSRKDDADFALNIVKTLDARPLLEEGIHPLGQVLAEVEHLEGDQVYELVTPFLPLPLIEKVKEKGFAAKSKEINSNEVRTYFKRNG